MSRKKRTHTLCFGANIKFDGDKTEKIHRLSLSVAAKVEVNMEDRVEVFKGETTPITCMFTLPEGVSDVIIEWFYVSCSNPDARVNRGWCVYACVTFYVFVLETFR